MKLVYIVGPYRSPKGIHGIVENIRRAEKVALKYWNKGYCVICPHKNTALMDGVDTDEMFLEGGEELVRRADVIVVMKGWTSSVGSVGEINLAIELNKKIIYE